MRTFGARPEVLGLFRGLFGTAGHCYRSLDLDGLGLRYATFRRYWGGLTVSGATHDRVQRGWELWGVRVAVVVGEWRGIDLCRGTTAGGMPAPPDS